MIRSPAGPGTIGPLWCLHLVAAIYARPRNKGTNAAAAARAGLEMSMKFNTRFTNVWAELQDPEALVRAPAYKPSSTETQDFKPQAKGSSFNPKSTSSRIREPGYKRTSWSRAQATRTKVFFLWVIWKDIW